MDDLEAELARARALDVSDLADAVSAIGFSCTRCGACCRGDGDSDGHRNGDEHTATVFPDEVRDIAGAGSAGGEQKYDWRDVARPMPFGLTANDEGEPSGETFEWALQTDACGDCTFYVEDDGADGEDAGTDGRDAVSDISQGGRCTVYDDRPLICQTYPFSVGLGGTEPMGEVVDQVGPVRAHECEGLGREIGREDAEAMARTLKERTIREVEEMIAVRDSHEPADPAPGEVVVHDSEGAKNPDGTAYR